MEKNVTFYKCPICGNVIGLIDGDSQHLRCCGQEMVALTGNEKDGATEKHVPVYERVENEILVKVGEVAHPMEEDHYIMWIAQVTENKTTRVKLKPGQPAEARLEYIQGSTIYAYCNKHSLWKTIVE